MDYSRRDLASLIGALSAASAAEQPHALPSKTYAFDDLPVKQNGQNRSRAVFNGELHTGFPVEMHITELAAGLEPHPPHQHVKEELVVIREGSLDVTISGKTTRLGPGGVIFVASNEHHGWKNPGPDRALYYVLALGKNS